jgi:hypothetical protein
METLKPLSEVTEPDARNLYFVVTELSGAARRLSLKDIHDIVSGITLHPGVPEAIRSHFSQAQNLSIYSWFHYPFNVTSQFLAFVSVEFALKHRLQSRASFKTLIRTAVESGLIKDHGFTIAAHREQATEPYVQTLIEVMPSLRNQLAHGTNMLHNNSISSLRICADFINQLFPAGE